MHGAPCALLALYSVRFVVCIFGVGYRTVLCGLQCARAMAFDVGWDGMGWDAIGLNGDGHGPWAMANCRSTTVPGCV